MTHEQIKAMLPEVHIGYAHHQQSPDCRVRYKGLILVMRERVEEDQSSRPSTG